MKNQFDFNDYELIQDKENNNWLFLTVIFLITIGIFIILYKLEFGIFEKQTLIKDNNQFFIMVNSKELSTLEKDDSIYINGKKYKYSIIKTNQDYTNINNDIYQTIYLDINAYHTEAIITECYFLKSKQTMYELIFQFIKGGIG